MRRANPLDMDYFSYLNEIKISFVFLVSNKALKLAVMITFAELAGEVRYLTLHSKSMTFWTPPKGKLIFNSNEFFK